MPDDNRREAKRRSGRWLAIGAVLAACAVAVALIIPLWCGPDASAPPAFPVADSTASAPVQAGVAENASPESNAPENEGAPREIVPAGADGIGVDHEAGVVLVHLADGATAADLSASLANVDCVGDSAISEDDVMLGYVTLPLSAGVSVPEAIAQLEVLPTVRGAQPNFAYQMGDNEVPSSTASADDDLVPILMQAVTRVNDYYAVNGEQWALESVKAYDAWDTVKTEGRVTVAVLDTGCGSWHEDLRNTVVNLSDATSDSGYGDMRGHGTHVAGIIAAEANNEVGVAGVSYNAGLLPIQVFTGKYTYTSDIVSAFNILIKHGQAYNVRVVNMSIGSTVSSREALEQKDSDKALRNAVIEAREKGMLTVCSSGNAADSVADSSTGALRGPYLNFPSDYLADYALTVIALEKTDDGVQRAAYSNYNAPGETTKEIAAPGSDIMSTYPSESEPYTELSGTSMASPCVAGIAALLFAANPDLTPDQVEQILCNNTTQLGGAAWTEEYGFGEVNAQAAVQSIGTFLDGKSYLLANGTDEQRMCTMTPVGATGAGSGAGSGAWSFSSSNEEVAIVDEATGVVTAVGSGTAIITATRPADDPEGEPTTVSRKVTAYEISFTGPTEVHEDEYIDLTFNENPDTGMWLIDTTNNQVLGVKCIENGPTRVSGLSQGEAYITATLAANPDLTVSHKVTVLEPRADFSQADVSMSGWTYDGTAHEPSVTVTLGDKLFAPDEYTLKYSNNKNAGTCTVTVTPTNSVEYKNTAKGTCVVAKRPVTLSSGSASKTYDGVALRVPGITLSAGSFVEGEEPTLLTTGAITNVGAVKNAIAVKGGNGFNADNYAFTLDEGVLTVTAAPLADIRVFPTSYIYDGVAHTPSVVVTGPGGRVLGEGVDYTLRMPSRRVSGGTYTVTAVGRGNYEGVKSASFVIEVDKITMFRLYNPNSGEHFYTADESERDNLTSLGWAYEGLGWNAPSTSNMPVYRMYNPNAGDHHYTLDADERDMLVGVGWNYEGVGWFSYSQDGLPLYRLYNPNAVAGAHHYTLDGAERDALVGYGWRYEGVGWHGA